MWLAGMKESNETIHMKEGGKLSIIQGLLLLLFYLIAMSFI